MPARKTKMTPADERILRGGRVERTLAAIFPELGYQRTRARARTLALTGGIERIRRYEAAAGGRRTSGWVRPGSSANAEIGPALHRLRAGSRDLRRNNAWADKAIRTRAADVVGLGIRPGPRSLLGEAEQDKIKEVWRAWAATTACDPNGLKTFYRIQDLAMQACDESGEVLIRRRRRRTGDGLPIPLQLQILEADHLDTLRDGLTFENGNRVIQGVEYDRLDRRVAYWLHPAHPGENYRTHTMQSERVLASEIIHLFDELRPGQVRGIPRGTSCLLRTRDFDDFEDAVLERQKLSNLYVGFIHDIDSTVETSGKFDEADVDEMQPGTYEHLPTGRTVTFANPPHAQGYSDYSKVSLRAIAAGYGTTYEALTGDMTQINFSSGRMGRLQYQREIAKFREGTLIPLVCDRVWAWFLEAAYLAGAIADPEAQAIWTPPRVEMIDPGKEIKAKLDAVRMGATTLTAVIRETGQEPNELLETWAADKALAEKLGIQLSVFTPEPGTPAAAPDPPEDDPDPDDDEAAELDLDDENDDELDDGESSDPEPDLTDS